MERHERFEPREYKHAELMGELNEFMVRSKVWLFEEAAKLRDQKPKPTIQEMDSLMFRLLAILRENSKPMRRE